MSINKPWEDPKPVPKYREYNKEIYERRVVHRLRLSDCDDPELYAAIPIGDWQQTDKGKWIMKNGLDPTYHIYADHVTYGYTLAITAYITPKRWTEYVLRGWDQL